MRLYRRVPGGPWRTHYDRASSIERGAEGLASTGGPLGVTIRLPGLRHVAALALATVPVAASGQTDPSLPGLPELGSNPPPARILDLALERAEGNEDAGVELAFECFVEGTVETLGADGAVLDVESTRKRRYALEGEMYEELVARDGQGLDDAGARKEAKRKAGFIRAARRRAARGEDRDPKDRRTRFDRSLMSRYRTVLKGTEEVRGHACWVLDYAPRSGRLPSEGAMDRALNQSTGTLWILRSNYELARILFEMREPVRYFWGLFASLKQADGRIEFEPVGDGTWLPSSFQLELDVALLAGIKSVRRRIGMRWVDYRAAVVGPEAAGESK